jgi:hypothetical protein
MKASMPCGLIRKLEPYVHLHAQYIRNLFPTNSHPTSCPRTIFTGEKYHAKLEPLLPFGQLEVVFNPESLRTKINPNHAEFGMFVGKRIENPRSQLVYIVGRDRVITRPMVYRLIEKPLKEWCWPPNPYTATRAEKLDYKKQVDNLRKNQTQPIPIIDDVDVYEVDDPFKADEQSIQNDVMERFIEFDGEKPADIEHDVTTDEQPIDTAENQTDLVKEKIPRPTHGKTTKSKKNLNKKVVNLFEAVNPYVTRTGRQIKRTYMTFGLPFDPGIDIESSYINLIRDMKSDNNFKLIIKAYKTFIKDFILTILDELSL